VTDETQTIKLKRSPGSPACYWELKTDFMWRNIRRQDYKLKIGPRQNVRVFAVSLFDDNRESTYYLDSKLQTGTELTFEMYNTTAIYVLPEDEDWAESEFEMSFYVNRTSIYADDMNLRYEKIPIYISGYGGLVLIFSILLYLEAFTTFY
jgi:hypothetical protein